MTYELRSLTDTGAILASEPIETEEVAWAAYQCAAESVCELGGRFELWRSDGERLASCEKKERRNG